MDDSTQDNLNKILSRLILYFAIMLNVPFFINIGPVLWIIYLKLFFFLFLPTFGKRFFFKK